MRTTLRRIAALISLSAAVALVVAAPAGAGSVSGEQTIVDQAAGTYEMSGDLVGDWAITSFTELATTPVYRAEGTEKFKGCLDRDRDGSCRGRARPGVGQAGRSPRDPQPPCGRIRSEKRVRRF